MVLVVTPLRTFYFFQELETQEDEESGEEEGKENYDA